MRRCVRHAAGADRAGRIGKLFRKNFPGGASAAIGRCGPCQREGSQLQTRSVLRRLPVVADASVRRQVRSSPAGQALAAVFPDDGVAHPPVSRAARATAGKVRLRGCCTISSFDRVGLKSAPF